jgi:hypothetical protein
MAGVFTAALRIGLLSASVLAVSLAADEARAATRDADPKAMVLRLSDMPVGFSLDKGSHISNLEAARESQVSLAQYRRWGRVSGYQAEYSRGALVGLIDVTSAASTYKTPTGAQGSTAGKRL